MNSIRQIQALNKRELENNVSSSASWHTDYRDTAWLYIGGLPFDLSEGDIITIFSQYGEPVHVNLVRDKETGKSKGFAFLKYEDQRSCDLAVDNLGGATVMGRMLRVDHTSYKQRDDEEGGDNVKSMGDEKGKEESESEEEVKRPMLKEERELAALMRDHDEEDPMKEYLIREKREEVAAALAQMEKKSSHKHRHGEGRSHRHRRRSRDRSGERKRGSEYKSKGRSRSREQVRKMYRDEAIPERRRRREDNGDRSRSREHRSHQDRYDDRR